MEIPHQMATLSRVLEKLRIQNMDSEFRWSEQGFTIGNGKYYQPADLTITKVYRFEGNTDPSDMAVVYVIEGNDSVIGYSLNAYGVYSNHENEAGYNNFIRLVPEKNHQDQLLFEL